MTARMAAPLTYSRTPLRPRPYGHGVRQRIAVRPAPNPGGRRDRTTFIPADRPFAFQPLYSRRSVPASLRLTTPRLHVPTSPWKEHPITPEQRSYAVSRTIHYMRMAMYDYAILEDANQPDNYLQFGLYGAGREIMHVEVTSRAYPDQALPPLTARQVDALVSLGFSRETDPDHAADIASTESDRLIEMCEHAFASLGSPCTFDLAIKTGYWHDNPIWKQLAAAKGYHDASFEREGRLMIGPQPTPFLLDTNPPLP